MEQDKWTFDGVEYTVSNYRANASGTDAGTYSNIVTSDKDGYKVTDPNGNVVTEEFSISVAPGTLTIKPVEATVTAGSATRAYNGSALTAAEAKPEFAADGFVGDDGIASAKVEIESNVAQSSVVLKNGTKASNYNITYKPGKLEVTPVTDEVVVTIAENSGNEEYNGSEQSVEGYELRNISNDSYAATDIEFVGSADRKVARGTDAGTYEMNLKPEDIKATHLRIAPSASRVAAWLPGTSLSQTSRVLRPMLAAVQMRSHTSWRTPRARSWRKTPRAPTVTTT